MTDPFEILGLEPAFALDRAALDKRHRELGRALHPDKFAQSGAGERRQALSRAIDVNEAYRRLKDPLARGEALLARLGITETNEPPPQEFLMDILEAREELSEAAKKKDLATLAKLATAFQQRQEAQESALASDFESALKGRTSEGSASVGRASKDTAPLSPELSTSLLRQLGALRYTRRFLEEAGTLLDELD